jgi:branched-chain amino acid aminotransferase
MPITPTNKIWMDGELVDWEDAKIHVLTHSLHYGTAVFEGIRAYETATGPAVFRLRDHIVRLLESAHILSLSSPFGVDELVEGVRDTLRASGLSACYIRPLIYLGYGEMGLNPLTAPVNVSISLWPWGAYLGDEGVARGIRLKVSSWARHDPRAMPTAAKATGMYLNSSLAKVEALRGGYDEALMMTTDGYLSEGSGENLFLVRDGVIHTPPNSAVGALRGITSDSVMKIARDLGFEVRDTLLRRPDLYLADEVFLTGTAAEVVPVAEVDDRRVGKVTPGPITKAIQDVYFAAVRGEDARYEGWLDRVE